MNDERVNELINKSIDGRITEVEKTELDNYLASDPKVNKEFKQLVQSSKMLAELPEYDAPVNIKKVVMNAVESSNSGMLTSPSKKMNAGLFHLSKRKFAFTMAFVVVVLIGVFVLWNHYDKSLLNKESVSGYMGKSEDLPFDARQIYTTDLLGIESALGIFQSKDTLYVTMDKKGSDEISIGYSFDPASVAFIGIRESNQTNTVIKKQEGRASVTLSSPSKVFALFRIIKPSSEMDVQVRNSERQVFRYKFTVASKTY